MTGPTDPEDPDDLGDWAFPEVAGPESAGPASVDLPAIDEGQHDTGSDAWWRAQAEAQRRAAQHDPVVPPAAAPVPPTEPPPDLVEPEVLQPGPPAASNPLDRDWLPPDLTEPTAAYAPDPEPSPEPEPQPVYVAPELPATRPPHEPARVGPARAVAGAALAIAGVAVGIGALLWAGSDEPKGSPIVSSLATERSTPSPTATPTPSPTVSPTPSPAGKPTPVATTPVAEPPQAPIVPVSVLNNSRIKGLADRAATRFRAGGWPVPVTGNYRGGIIATTTVYFAPGQQASAQRFARQFGIPRVAPRFAGLPTRGMTVVLTRDYR